MLNYNSIAHEVTDYHSIFFLISDEIISFDLRSNNFASQLKLLGLIDV